MLFLIFGSNFNKNRFISVFHIYFIKKLIVAIKKAYTVNDSLFILSGLRYITLFNTNTNQIKKINFIKEDNFDKRRKKDFLNTCPNLFRYNSDSIILIALEGIFIIKVINEEKIQVQLRIFHKLIYSYLFEFNEEEKSIYFEEKNFWYKLKIKSKYIEK